MIQTQTFEYRAETKDELSVIARALDLLAERCYDEAARVLIARQDVLTREPKLKLYGT